MFPGDEDDTVPYAAWDIADLPTKISTPAARRMAAIGTKPDRSRFLEDLAFPMPSQVRTPAETSTPAMRRATMEMPPDRSRLLSEIDFDDPVEPMRTSLREKTGDPTTEKMKLKSDGRVKIEEIEKTGDPTTEKMKLKSDGRVKTEETEKTGQPMNSTMNLLESVSGLLRNRPMPMKPGKFDGTGSLESFLVQFEVCARHNKWTAADRVDYLRCSLEKAATQLLWDFGAQPSATYEELVERLRQRYGTEGQAETFRAQLYYRRQRPEENLSDLLHEIRRLVVLAYPVPSNETTQIIAKDSFLEAMRDRELSLKVREREPKNLDEAYRTALRLEAYQRTNDADDRRRPPNRVRGTQETDLSAQLQAQMDRFLNTQRDEQRKWQQEMEKRMDEQFRVLRRSPPTTDEPSHEIRPERDRPGPPENQRREMTCFNCGRAGHMARNCRRDRRYQNRQNRQNATTEPDASTPLDPVVMNHTTRPRMPDRATNNAVYIRGEINGRPQLCLIDTGSERSEEHTSELQSQSNLVCRLLLEK